VTRRTSGPRAGQKSQVLKPLTMYKIYPELLSATLKQPPFAVSARNARTCTLAGNMDDVTHRQHLGQRAYADDDDCGGIGSWRFENQRPTRRQGTTWAWADGADDYHLLLGHYL